MSLGMVGKKVGMTQIFTEDGLMYPATVLELGPNYILQVKSKEKDGYEALQIGFLPKKWQRANKPMQGHFEKANRGAFYKLVEIRASNDELQETLKDELKVGGEIKVGDIFQEGEVVDVQGVSKGRGFAGVVKRFGVAGQPATRGTHEYRRNIGSVGCRKFPGRIWKNQKMPGHYGNEKVTVKNLNQEVTVTLKGSSESLSL
ncbi:MAG: 50S ribosomal protein L3, partial [Candidatus Dadabacteria bacterium]